MESCTRNFTSTTHMIQILTSLSRQLAEERQSPPLAEGRWSPPLAEGRQSPPLAEGRESPPLAEGRQSPPLAEGRRSPPLAEGRRSPPLAEGGEKQLMAVLLVQDLVGEWYVALVLAFAVLQEILLGHFLIQPLQEGLGWAECHFLDIDQSQPPSTLHTSSWLQSASHTYTET